jgi:hypothetical protein
MMKKLLLFLALIFIPSATLGQTAAPVVGNGANINGTSPTLSGLSVGSSTTAGSIKIGGNTASCTFNYGVTVAAVLTFPCAVTVSGGMTTITGGLTVTSNIGGSGYAFNTGSSSYGATSATVNGPLTTTAVTAGSFLSSNGVGIADDAASVHGLNIFTATSSTNGVRIYNGPNTSSNLMAQFSGGNNLNLNPNNTATCLEFNNAFNNTCPIIDNSTDGGLNLAVAASSAYGYRFYTEAGSSGTVLAQLNSNAFTLNPNGSGDCIQFQAGYTPNCPDITNSSDNGINFFDSYASSLGYRWFSVQSNGSLTGLMSLNNLGNAQIAGTLLLGTAGGDAQGATTPELNINGDINVARNTTTSGVIYFGSVASQYIYFNGSTFVLSGGPVEATATQGFQLGTGTAITEQSTTVAGTSCGYFDFQIVNSTSLMCIDGAGNVGAAGNYYAASQRKLKNNIQNYSGQEALKIALNTQIVRYCYKTEKCKSGEERHIGFIADDTSTDIAPNHTSMDVNASAAVALAAIRYQQTEITHLQKEINNLKNNSVMKTPKIVVYQTSANTKLIFLQSLFVNVVLLGFIIFAWGLIKKFLKHHA